MLCDVTGRDPPHCSMFVFSMPSKYTAKVVLGLGKWILYECIGSLLKYFLEEITRDKSENVPFAIANATLTPLFSLFVLYEKQ